MKKTMRLGLTTAIGAIAIAGTAVLIQDGMRARVSSPDPHHEGRAPSVEAPKAPPQAPAPPERPAPPEAPAPEEGLAAAPAVHPARPEPEADSPAPAGLESFRSGERAALGLVGRSLVPRAPRPGEGRQVAAERYRRSSVGVHEMKKDEAHYRAPRAPVDREGYDHISDNPFLAVSANPLSTFSIDVDTASYANVRRFLTGGQLPPKDAVRIEELVNYFRYEYPEPRRDQPFSISSEVGSCPWKPEHRLVLVGLRGRSLDDTRLPPRNLTFLLDVSGSMGSPDKLPLLKRAMGLLVNTLREEDRVAIVVYAGASGLVLPPTSGAQKGTIMAALESLRSGGSTAGGAGIELAYRVAARSYVEGGINRVILATDGDFNVGLSSEGDLVRLIEEKRKGGVFLSVLGFGQGNLQDSKMEKLADHGNGNYSYIDTIREARKVLVTEAGATLVTIAKDVKIQVEFNPARVQAYRLIGYENRALRAEDFADDRKDAGEIGAGHTVTALYEVVPVGVEIDLPVVDPLKYQAAPSARGGSRELLTVKLRHKAPDGDRSRLRSVAVTDPGDGLEPSANLRFASAVAAFGMLLRDSEHRGSASWSQVIELARGAVGQDPDGHRNEFLVLARSAEQLSEIEQVAISR